MDPSALTLDVLGPTHVGRAGDPVELRRRERDVLAALAMDGPNDVPLGALIDRLWPVEVPATGRVTLQNHVSRIRRALGPGSVVTSPGAYRLAPDWDLDIGRHAALVDQAARWSRVDRPDLAVRRLDEASALVRGAAFVDLGDAAEVVATRRRLDEVARSAEDALLVALLGSGETARAVGEGRVLAEAEPFREQRWAALVVALYRDGQRRDAARALHRGQHLLRERIGIEGGPILHELERLVLDDAEALMTMPPARLVGRSDAGPARPPRSERRVPRLGVDDLAAAARTALENQRHRDAVDLFTSATREAEERWGGGDRRTLRLRLEEAEARRLAGETTDGLWAVVEAAEEIGDPDTLARAAAGLCRLGPSSAAGTLDEGIADVVERAIATCTDLRLRADCLSQAALFYSMTGRIERALDHFEASLADARASADPATLLGALGGTYPILTDPADQDRRAALAAEMLALAERLDDDEGRFGALHLYFEVQLVGADPLLRTTFAHQDAIARRLRSAPRRWMVAYQRAILAYLDGNLDAADEISQDAFATAPVSPSRAVSTRIMCTLVVRLAQGRGEELTPRSTPCSPTSPGSPAGTPSPHGSPPSEATATERPPRSTTSTTAAPSRPT